MRIITVLVTSLVVAAAMTSILTYFGIAPWSEENESDQYNVTSYNQQGGITAGQVNVGRPPRHLDESSRAKLMAWLSKGKEVRVVAVVGDRETFQLATEINDFLLAEGYEANGVTQSMIIASDGPYTGVRVELGDTFDQIIVGPQE